MNFDLKENADPKRMIYAKMGFPLVYTHYKLEDTDLFKMFNKSENDQWIKFYDYYSNLEKNYKNRTGLFLHGNFGCGKTSLSTIILKKYFELVETKVSEITKKHSTLSGMDLPQLRFMTGYDVADIASRFNLSEYQLKLRERIYKYAILCIDDFEGVNSQKDNDILFIENLIRRRYLDHNITMFTSNAPLEKLTTFSKSIRDMIEQSCVVINLPKVNFRK